MKQKITQPKVLFGGLLLYLTLFSGVAFAEWRHVGGGYAGNHMMGAWGMGWMMIVFWGLVLIGLISLTKWLLMMTGKENKGFADSSPNAIGILKERLARGDIDPEEYDEKKRLILANR